MVVVPLILLGAVAFPSAAAPSYLSSITLNDIDGLDGNADADFWAVDYFDTNGRGDANDPSASLAAAPISQSGYGSTALRMTPGNGTGGSGCSSLGGKVFFGTKQLAGTKLKNITQLGYSFLVDQTNGTTAGNKHAVNINLFIDRNGDGQWTSAADSILVYEPINTLLNITQDTWIDSPVIGLGALGNWHVEGQPILGLGLGIPLLDSIFNQIILLPALGLGLDPLALTIGDLKIVNPPAGCSGSSQTGTGSGLTLVVGSTSGSDWNNFVGFVDGLYVSVSGANALNTIINLNVIGDPVTATILGGNNQLVALNGILEPIVVELRDANGLLADIGTIASIDVPLLGSSVTFFPLSATVTDLTGTVVFNGIANGILGDLVATVTSFLASVNIDLSLTDILGSTAADIAVSSGDGQTATINTAYASPVVAVVTDDQGDPVEGVTVTFSAPASGASVTFPSGNTVDTDANGFASVPVTANGTAGSVTVVAVTTDIENDVAMFSLTNIPVMPTAVSSLNVIPASRTAISVSWAGVPDNGDTYTLYRSSDGVNFAPVATMTVGQTNYMDSGLVCGVTYTYRMDASNSAGTATGSMATANTNPCDELLINGDFNLDTLAPKKMPSAWRGKRTGRDGQRCADTGKAFDGGCYLAFKTRTEKHSRLLQDIDVTGLAAGQTLTLSANGWTKGGAKGTVEMIVSYSNQLRSRHQIRWNANTQGYIAQEVSYILEDTPSKIVVRIRSRVRKGTWFLDGLSLTMTNAGAMRLPPR